MALKRACAIAVTFAVLAVGLSAADTASAQDARMPKTWPVGGPNDAIGSFLHQWQVCGLFPLPAPGRPPTDYLGGEAAAKPGGKVVLPGGAAVEWKPYTMAGDHIELADVFPGQKTDKAVAYLAAAPQGAGEQPVKVYMSVASNGPTAIWLNGTRVYAYAARRFYVPDIDLVPVTLQPGPNRLLVRLESVNWHWSFALRFLTQGQVEQIALPTLQPPICPTAEDLAPDGTLSVAPDTGPGKWLPDPAPVTVQALAPGGKVIATVTVPRSGSAFFHTADWPAGPYEFCCSKPAPDGKTVYGWQYWYKGDYLVQARDLLDERDAMAKGSLIVGGKVVDPASPKGALLNVLADLIVDRLSCDPRSDPAAVLPIPAQGPADWRDIQSVLLEHREWQIGDPARVHPGGFVRMAWIDPVDNSPQFARLYLPPQYDPKVKWPMVIHLHGSGPIPRLYIGWGAVTKRHDPLADNYGVIMLEPHGRGNGGYTGFSEEDVLRAIRLAKESFSVDDDRVYLMGHSMGGFGTWSIGTRHPELFAALAPISGTLDSHVRGRFEEPADLTPMQRLEQDRRNSLSQAEALLTTPIFVNHGDKDPQVSVEGARYAVRALQRWGYDVRYIEIPGAGHGDLGTDDAIMRFFLEHKRTADPRVVRVRSGELKSASAFWVRVTRSKEPATYICVEAEIVDRHTIRLNTDNVAAIRLTPGPDLIDRDAPVSIIWNASLLAPQKFVDGAVGFGNETGFAKTPEVEGPLSDATNKPFAIVVGTISKDPAMKRFVQMRAEAERDRWDTRQHVVPRYFADTEITEEQMRRCSLLLFGGPEENLVTRKLIENLPLKLDPESITIDGRRFEAKDAAVAMIYPNPLNPSQYVTVTAANSPAGMFFADRLSDLRDFAIADGRAAPGRGRQGGFGNAGNVLIASGYFNEQWKLDEKYLVLGDPAVRAQALMRKAPVAPAAAANASVLMLSEALESAAAGSFGRMMRDLNALGRPIALAGKTYNSGIGVGAVGQSNTVDYDLAGAGWKRLRATIGLELSRKPEEFNDADKSSTRLSFVVLGDGKELYRSPVFDYLTQPIDLDVDVSSVKTLRLQVVNEKKAVRNLVDSVDWADARLER